MTQIIHPGIPGTNYWYISRGQARKAALRYATSMGPGYTIVSHRAHAHGQQPHYHVVDPTGAHLRIHFFYGRRRPIKAPRGARSFRETEYELEGEYESELDQFLDSIWDWFRPTAPTIISRSGWSAQAPKCSQTLAVPVRYAFIHHTAGNTPAGESAERAAMRGTQRYHQVNKGWCDIAYNFVIMPSGRVYEGRGWRRVNGATKGYNSNSLAFCFAGNFENTRPTAAAIDAGRAMLYKGMRDGYLTPDFILRGHRDVGSTACPGRYLYPRLGDLDPR